MSFTLDYTTNIGKVRALTGDVDQTRPRVQDEQIQCFLDLDEVDSNIYIAGAMCLEATASRRGVVASMIQLADLQIDVGTMVKDLRAQAQILRDMAYNSVDNFEIALMELTPYAVRDHELNKLVLEGNGGDIESSL
jgi:hypothetical protein